MEDFERNVAKGKKEIKTVIALIVVLPFIALLVLGYIHVRNEHKAVERYLEQERPEVILAIEAFKADHGHYPNSISEAVPRYYKGQQKQLFFLEKYEYRNSVTNFFLKDFDRLH